MSCKQNALDLTDATRYQSGVQTPSSPKTYAYAAMASAALCSNGDSDLFKEVLATMEMTPRIAAVGANDPSPSIRAEVAGNTKTPPEIITRLAKDRDPRVAKAALLNPSGPYASTISVLGNQGIALNEAIAVIQQSQKSWQETPRCGSCGCWVKRSNPVCKNQKCSKNEMVVDATPAWRSGESLSEKPNIKNFNPYGAAGYLRLGDMPTRAAFVQKDWEAAKSVRLTPLELSIFQRAADALVQNPTDSVALGGGVEVKFDENAGFYAIYDPDISAWVPVSGSSSSVVARNAIRFMKHRGHRFSADLHGAESYVNLRGDMYAVSRKASHAPYSEPADPPALPPLDFELPSMAGGTGLNFSELFNGAKLTGEEQSAINRIYADLPPNWRNDSASRRTLLRGMKEALPADMDMAAELAFNKLWMFTSNRFEVAEASKPAPLSIDDPRYEMAAKAWAEAKTELSKIEARRKAIGSVLANQAADLGQSFKVGPVVATYTSGGTYPSFRPSVINQAVENDPTLLEKLPWLKTAQTVSDKPASVSMRYPVQETPVDPAMFRGRPERLAEEYMAASKQAALYEARMEELSAAMAPAVISQGKSQKTDGPTVVYNKPQTGKVSWDKDVIQQHLADNPELKEQYSWLTEAFSFTERSPSAHVRIESA